eukprot:700335-Rhodomonas_salina.5
MAMVVRCAVLNYGYGTTMCGTDVRLWCYKVRNAEFKFDQVRSVCSYARATECLAYGAICSVLT